MSLPFFLAKRFVSGRNLSEIMVKLKQVNQEKLHNVTINVLGETATSENEIKFFYNSYKALIDALHTEKLPFKLSLKLSMFGLGMKEYNYRMWLERLLKEAYHKNIFVRIDMEHSRHTEETIHTFLSLHRQYPNHLGIVIQAYLRRSLQDIDSLIDHGCHVRLCKGAYQESSQVALQNMIDIRKNFKRIAQRLLLSNSHTAIATHDDELIDWVCQFAKDKQIAKDRYEFQMLYGLREKTLNKLSQAGYHTCIYMPYGKYWVSYFSRRLMERPQNVWFVLTTILKK